MYFDPLSLFTPCSNQIEEDDSNVLNEYKGKGESLEIVSNKLGDNDDDNDGDDDEHLYPIHILDLPLLELKPPRDVIIVILKLFSPNEVYNFIPDDELLQNSDACVDIDEVFKEKDISEDMIQSALDWLKNFCPRLDSRIKLGYLPKLCSSLRKNIDYNSYITKIIASDLSWIQESDKVFIFKEASLRISENCGRTAQPEIIRKIVLPNLNKYLTTTKFIKLKEPSLTSDNLGLKTWGSSLILSNRLINKGNDYLVDPVIELGSGTGLVGMVSSILGHTTILSDLKEIVPNLEENIKLNNVNAKAEILDWTNPQPFIDIYGNIKFNTILISDPIYSPKHPYWVVNMLDLFLSNSKDARILIQLPLRPKYEEERAVLWSLMSKNFKEIENEIEDGQDDFGNMKFCFKMYIRNVNN